MDKSKSTRNGRRSQSRFVWTPALTCICALSASYAIALLCAYALGWNTAPDFFASEFRICVTRTPMIEIASWLSAALAFYWGLSCFFSQQSLVWQLREVRDMNSAPRNVIPTDSANQVFRCTVPGPSSCARIRFQNTEKCVLQGFIFSDRTALGLISVTRNISSAAFVHDQRGRTTRRARR